MKLQAGATRAGSGAGVVDDVAVYAVVGREQGDEVAGDLAGAEGDLGVRWSDDVGGGDGVDGDVVERDDERVDGAVVVRTEEGE